MIEISLDWEKFDHKPNKNQYKDFKDSRGKIITELMILGSRVGKNVKTLTIEQLANALTLGQTWSPFIFNKDKRTGKVRRRIELFNRCNTLALDFDDGITYDEILKNCKNYDLTPNIIHESFSSTKELRKFRVIFALDKTYTCSREVRLMIMTLLKWFPNADRSAKDLARIMFGTNKTCNYVNSSTRNIINPDPDLIETEEKDLVYLPPDNVNGTFQYSTYDQFKKDFLNLSCSQQRFIQKVVKQERDKILYLNSQSGVSRYEIVFSCAEKLTGIKGLYGEAILYYLVTAIKSNSYFNDWTYNPYDVINSAIIWKSNTPNIRSGHLFEIEEFFSRTQN